MPLLVGRAMHAEMVERLNAHLSVKLPLPIQTEPPERPFLPEFARIPRDIVGSLFEQASGKFDADVRKVLETMAEAAWQDWTSSEGEGAAKCRVERRSVYGGQAATHAKEKATGVALGLADRTRRQWPDVSG